MAKPPKFIFESTGEHLTEHAGLAIVGALLPYTQLRERLDETLLPEMEAPIISHADVAVSYVGLLCQGKTDFECIEAFREEPFFKTALGIQTVPSAATLRQRLDAAGVLDKKVKDDSLSQATRAALQKWRWKVIVMEENLHLLRNAKAPLTPIQIRVGGRDIDYHVLDIDVSPFDNSNTKKEGVSRTYKGVDGYAPIFAYLGREGYLIHLELREGKVHCQNGMCEFLTQAIQAARTVLPRHARLLVRLDSGHDAADTVRVCREMGADFIIKRNLRREAPEMWLDIAKERGIHCEDRPGKFVYMGNVDLRPSEEDAPVTVAFRVVMRQVLQNGQALLYPDIQADTFWTSLSVSASRVVDLYADHGTAEQFHSELKTDLNLERLPSGKFATNELVLTLGALAYNLLRIIGQEGLRVDDAPLKKPVHRRRIRTVIDNLITLAARLSCHARRWRLGVSTVCPWLRTIRRVYEAFA